MKRSPSILPSILHVYPSPSQSMQPHTITDPPPNFTIPSTSLSLSPSPALFQACFLPCDPRQLILVSSDYTTLFQSPRVQSLCLIAKSILSFLCFYDRKGFFFFTTAFIPVHLRCLHTVWGVMGWLVICWSAFETCTVLHHSDKIRGYHYPFAPTVYQTVSFTPPISQNTEIG